MEPASRAWRFHCITAAVSAMSFVVYFLVLLVAAGSVLFGLDWLQSPIPASPPGRPTVPIASAPAKSARPATATSQQNAKQLDAKQLDAKLSPVYPASPGVPLAVEAEAANGPAAQPRPASLCDIDACARAYYSFRPSDCTFQPVSGPRTLCTKGNPSKSAAQTAAAAANATQARAEASCNIEACQRAYTSFNASDCTYQPYYGPRRLCTK